jgi:hypothetical protein
MCWSAEVSLNTFIFAIISFCIVVSFNKLPIITVFIALSISLIQLYEYFAWKNIHNKKIIHYLSWFGPLIILLQVLLINYAYLRDNEINIGIIMIIIIAIISMIYNYKNNKFDMEVGENKHLIWYWVDLPPILLILIFFFYLYPLTAKQNILPFICVLIMLLISLYYYYKYKTWGTMWCYFSNLIWIVLIIKTLYLYFTDKYKNKNKYKT